MPNQIIKAQNKNTNMMIKKIETAGLTDDMVALVFGGDAITVV